jgi:protein O-GlcNAc transferase
MASSVDETFRNALAAMQTGQADAAEQLFKQALQLQPRHVAALNLFGILLTSLGRLEEAEHYTRRALDENASSDATIYNHGVILKALRRHDEALERFTQALKINASSAETWNNRGTVFNDLMRHREAVADFDRAIAINSSYADAFLNKGKALASLMSYEESLAAFDRALALNPDLTEAWFGRGYVSAALQRYDDAAAAYDRALALNPDLAGVWLNRGNVAFELKRHDDALAAYSRALALDPGLAEAWLGRALIALDRKQYDDAFAAYDRALRLKPDLNYAEGDRLHVKLHLADWTNLGSEVLHLLSAVTDQKPVIGPFPFLSIPSSPADQLQCVERYNADEPPFPPIWRGDIYSHDRIRVAYLSANLNDHPMSYLIAGLFEQHDKSRFEITALSFGPDRPSDIRDRMKRALEHFVDVRHKSDQELAEHIRRIEIDIVVDLMGFTDDERHGVLARRAAPIQVSYLGFPGTMGAGYIDYILADATVIPEDQFPYYRERVVWLPDSYYVNDRQRRIAEHTPTRRECALPETAFVFCCFNNTYKITPDIFDIWMRLLGANEQSVLWLIETNATATANLRREAEQRGIASDRLIFAPKIPVADHLARHRQADLFLDTLPYNAHTTACDALWAGVPVLTCLGSAFVGRVAASLLKAVGLDDLITNSLKEYEALALKLAGDPAHLASIKRRLADNRMTAPLFDTERFARHMEAAYTTMWDRHRKGEPPQAFAVSPLG